LQYLTKHSSVSSFNRKKIGCTPCFVIVLLHLFGYKREEGNRRVKTETIDKTSELTRKTFSDSGSKIKGEGE
jgi:hypothetical protein